MNDNQKIIKAYNELLRKYENFNIRENIDYVFSYKLKTDYFFIKYIPNGLRNKKVLDVGTFIPFDPIYWAAIVEEFHSIDINQDVVDFSIHTMKKELSEELLKKVTYQKASGIEIPYEDNYFDVVLSFSAIDHIPKEKDRNKTFSEIARVTKRKGFIVVTLPNKLNFLAYRRSMNLQKKGICKAGFEAFYTPKELKKIMINNNLKPLYFCSSAGDKGGDIPYLSDIYNKIFYKFGGRMGWLAQKI